MRKLKITKTTLKNGDIYYFADMNPPMIKIKKEKIETWIPLEEMDKLIEELQNWIRLQPNRDDELYAEVGEKPQTKKLSIATLDGGGIGKFAVKDKIKELLNEIKGES